MDTALASLDFNDVHTVMSGLGLAAMMGTGIATGKSRAREAAIKAITIPLQESEPSHGARDVLMSITCGFVPGIDEVSEAVSIVTEAAHKDAYVIFGVARDGSMGDEM